MKQLLKKIKIWVFSFLTVITVIAIQNVELAKDTALQGILQSMIAAYIFYLIMNVIPDIVGFISDLKQELADYRRLQMMLDRLRGLFIQAIEQSNLPCENPHKMKLKDFYNKKFLSKYINKVDFEKKFKEKPISLDHDSSTYKEYYVNEWQIIKNHGQALLASQFVKAKPKLWSEINELINQSTLSSLYILFKRDFIIRGFSSISYSWIDNVLELHYSALEWYKYLRLFFRNKKYTLIAPVFFRKEQRKDNKDLTKAI